MQSLSTLLFSFFLVVVPGPGWLGVFLADSDGAVVREVIPGTPAEKAGLEAGDVLLAVNGEATATRDAFVAAIQGREAGDRVRIKLRRGEREQTVVVKLGERPESVGAGTPTQQPPRPSAPSAPNGGRLSAPNGGRLAAPREPSAPASEPRVGRLVAPQGGGKPYLGISVRDTDRGVLVDRVLDEGPAARGGVSAGEILLSLGDHRVRDLDQLDAALGKFRVGQKVAVNLQGEHATRSILVELGRRPGDAGGGPVAVEVVEEVRVPATEVHADEPAHEEAVHEEVVEAPLVTEGVVLDVKPEVRRAATQRELRRELAELRKELAELRKALEDLRRSQRGDRK